MFSGLVFAAQSFGLRVRACLGFRKLLPRNNDYTHPRCPLGLRKGRFATHKKNSQMLQHLKNAAARTTKRYLKKHGVPFLQPKVEAP